MSACVKIPGEITCDAFNGEGPIYIAVFNIEGKHIDGVMIDSPGDYTITLPINYLNTLVYVSAVWDHDNNFPKSYEVTIGDYWNKYGGTGGSPFQLGVINNDIDIDQKITASISGIVNCDAHTSGEIYVHVWDDESTSKEHWVSMPSSSVSEPGPYTVFIRNVEIDNPIWVIGFWDKDGSGPTHSTAGDYIGNPENPIYLEEEITGIDFVLDTEY